LNHGIGCAGSSSHARRQLANAASMSPLADCAVPRSQCSSASPGAQCQCALQGLRRQRCAACVQLQDRQVAQRLRVRGCLHAGLHQQLLRARRLAIAQRARAGMHELDHGPWQAGHPRVGAHPALRRFSRRACMPGRQEA
jgi:hypothetical protein